MPIKKNTPSIDKNISENTIQSDLLKWNVFIFLFILMGTGLLNELQNIQLATVNQPMAAALQPHM